MVHVKPQGSTLADAKLGKADLKPISQLKVGDEVLAQAEWKEIGSETGQDARLSYQPIEDIFSSNKEQILVHLTLDNGEKLTATDGHPFKTSDGWCDAIVLKAGSKLLLKSDGESTERTATVVSISTEQTTVPVFSIEVATAHTFFVGEDGELVHNSCPINRITKHTINRHVERQKYPEVILPNLTGAKSRG